MKPSEAARRAAEYEKTRDPRVLWPQVTEGDFFAAMGAVTRLTAARLAQPASHAELTNPIPGGLRAFGVAAFASGMGPLLGYWSEQGDLALPDALAALLNSHLEHGRRRAARLREELERMVRAFADAGVQLVILKGMHTGWDYFPDPGCRPASDVDLLVPDPGDRERAMEIFRALGLTAGGEPMGTSWYPPDHRPPVAIDVTHEENPWNVDLHTTTDRRFVSGDPRVVRFGRCGPSDLRTWHVGGRTAHVLAQPLLTGFLTLHACQHFPQLPLLRIAELAIVIRRDLGGASNWEALWARLDRAGGLPYAYPALKLTEDLVPTTVDGAFLQAVREVAIPGARGLADKLTPARALHLYRRSVEARFLWIPTRRERVRAFLRWLWPRDSAGAPLPFVPAMRFIGRRARRLVRGGATFGHR